MQILVASGDRVTIAHPLWYPTVPEQVRIVLLRFAEAMGKGSCSTRELWTSSWRVAPVLGEPAPPVGAASERAV